MDTLNLPAQSNDIFSISDEVLANRLQFIEEIGFGNWGSVWLCRPKSESASSSKYKDVKIAVKLVHRSKTRTTAARVRSLWNEMKVVRSLKNEPHPSIIPFYSFIITQSYALITMAFLPRLVPVEVDEKIAKRWFQSLLSGVDFLHRRGVVHNDIKPANILLSEQSVPVLVDFGFAEKYDMNSSKAFKSNLAYGTPEYLSPERARGLYHDTRKSDVWSLGITFFEILIGRTPFEYVEGEEFSTKEDLEKYWARTLRGKWVGSWKISKNIEKMLRRMIAPNADVRCTADEAIDDPYWATKETVKPVKPVHRKSASVSHAAFTAMNIDMDASKLLNIGSPFTTRTLGEKRESRSPNNKENVASPSSCNTSIKMMRESLSTVASRAKHTRSQSQSKLPGAQDQVNASTSGLKPLIFAPLEPIKGSTTSSAYLAPPTKPTVAAKRTSYAGKENVATVTRPPSDVRTKKPAGPRKAPITPERKKSRKNAGDENLPLSPKVAQTQSVGRQGRVLMERSMNSNLEDSSKRHERDANVVAISSSIGKSSVKARWLDWERERERLREMDSLHEKETEEERSILQEENEIVDAPEESVHEPENQTDGEKGNSVMTVEELEASEQSVVVSAVTPERNTPIAKEPITAVGFGNGLPRPSALGSSLSILKQSLIVSIDKGLQLYKTSNVSQLGTFSSKDLSGEELNETRREVSVRQSWEDDSLIREANSSLPTVRHAVRNERFARENNDDRMNLWIRNVEKVVEEARQGFAATPTATPLLTPLPVAPSRQTSQKKAPRLPQKILTANEIFIDGGEAADQSQAGSENSVALQESSLPASISEQATKVQVPGSPPRARRATVITRSPEVEIKIMESPSKRRQKSMSQCNLLGQAISSLGKLEMELEKLSIPAPTTPTRLSAVVDKSLFITSRPISREEEERSITDMTGQKPSTFPVVKHYPQPTRVMGTRSLDSPNTKRRIESQYDQMITSTNGVKKVGLGYQSDPRIVVSNIAPGGSASKRNYGGHSFFLSARRPMPPPVSSEDWRKTVSVDELGMITTTTPTKLNSPGVEKNSVVRKAINIMTGKTMSRRLSRIA